MEQTIVKPFGVARKIALDQSLALAQHKPQQAVARTCIPNRIASVGGGTGNPSVINIRYPLWVPDGLDFEDIFFRWANMTGDPSSTPLNTVTIRAGLESPAGYTTPIWWSNGSRDMTLEIEAVADTVPVPVRMLCNTKWWLRYRITVPTDGTYALTDLMYAGEGGQDTTGGDKTLSGSIGNSGATRIALPPLACFGTPIRPSVRPVSVALLTDSIGVGATDDGGGGSGTLHNGFICRALTNQYRYTHLGVQGLSWGSLNPAVSSPSFGRIRRRMEALRGGGFTHCLINLGTNDITSDAATITIPYAQAVCDIIESYGVKPILMTLTPRTSAANTAPHINNANLLTYNTWVRTNPRGWGYFDANAVARDPANTNLWRTDLGTPTADETHPNSVIHVALGTALAAALPSLLV